MRRRTTRQHQPARRMRGDDGAVLVEFAILAPVLFLIIFGIIEFGWAWFNNLDVRHGAREGVRLAAVDFANGNTANLVTEICDRMDETDEIDIAVTVNKTLVSPNSTAEVGDEVTVQVRKPLNTLTGFLDFALPDGITLQSSVKTRLEQDTTYTNENAESLPGNDCP